MWSARVIWKTSTREISHLPSPLPALPPSPFEVKMPKVFTNLPSTTQLRGRDRPLCPPCPTPTLARWPKSNR